MAYALRVGQSRMRTEGEGEARRGRLILAWQCVRAGKRRRAEWDSRQISDMREVLEHKLFLGGRGNQGLKSLVVRLQGGVVSEPPFNQEANPLASIVAFGEIGWFGRPF